MKYKDKCYFCDNYSGSVRLIPKGRKIESVPVCNKHYKLTMPTLLKLFQKLHKK